MNLKSGINFNLFSPPKSIKSINVLITSIYKGFYERNKGDNEYCSPSNSFNVKERPRYLSGLDIDILPDFYSLY